MTLLPLPDGVTEGEPAAINARGDYAIGAAAYQPGRPNIAVPVPAGSTGVSPRIIAMSDDGHRLTGQLYDEFGVSVSGLITWTCS